MNYSAEIRVRENKDLLNCFVPEKFEKERTSYKVKKIKNNVVFEIKSKDIAAFRATVNSITQMLTVYEKMKKIAK